MRDSFKPPFYPHTFCMGVYALFSGGVGAGSLKSFKSTPIAPQIAIISSAIKRLFPSITLEIASMGIPVLLEMKEYEMPRLSIFDLSAFATMSSPRFCKSKNLFIL